MTKNINHMDKTYVEEVLTKQVATFLLSNPSITDCAKQFSITTAAVRRITNSPKYKELVSTKGDEELGPALQQAKAQLARLTTKSVKVLEKAMDVYLETGTGGREAMTSATIQLKAVGLNEEQEKQQDTSITVVLPSGTEIKTYDAEKVED